MNYCFSCFRVISEHIYTNSIIDRFIKLTKFQMLRFLRPANHTYKMLFGGSIFNVFGGNVFGEDSSPIGEDPSPIGDDQTPIGDNKSQK